MRLIRPTVITDAILTACDVPETDYAAWNSGTAYVVGNRCIRTSTHRIYECLVNNTNFTPETNTSGVTPKWLDCGATNRWKMFDAVVGSRTTQANSITLTLTPAQIVDSIAFLDLVATTIDVVMTDPVEGVVYTEHIDLISKSFIVDLYTYFFEPIITDDACVLLGVPAYLDASLEITITNTGATAEIGTLVIGAQKYLGGTQYAPSIGINDYSKKDVDAFGNFTVLQRAYTKRMSCELFLENNLVDILQRTLAEYRATPVVWVGTDENFSCMLIYGFFKSFTITIIYLTHSTCSLEVEGLS